MDIQAIILPEGETFKQRKKIEERILIAASNIMSKKGIADSGMKEIAATAGGG